MFAPQLVAHGSFHHPSENQNHRIIDIGKTSAGLVQPLLTAGPVPLSDQVAEPYLCLASSAQSCSFTKCFDLANCGLHSKECPKMADHPIPPSSEL